METRRIKARNGEGLTFTVVGLGTGPLGELFELLDEKTAIATVEQALASGVRVFDSSPHYGNGLAESRMGAGLRRAPATRSSFRPRSAASWTRSAKSPMRQKTRSRPASPADIRTRRASTIPMTARCGRSSTLCLRMGLDRLDIVLIHDCDVWTHGKEEAPARFKEAMSGAYRALDKLRNEKVVKAIGFGINEADTCVKFALAGDFDVAMMAGRYTLIDQTGLEPNFCRSLWKRTWA